MNSLEVVDDTESVSTVASTRNLLSRSRVMERKRKNKLACGVMAMICIAGITIGIGFLFIQDSEFVEEKFHGPEDDSQHEPIAQAQHQSQSVVFDLPDTDGSHSPTRPMNSSSSSDSTGQPRPVIPTNATKPLPPNAQTKHAVSLLFELGMRPPPVFHDFTCANSRPRAYFKTSLTVGGNGKEYFGYGNKKRISKKLAAQQACTDLFQLTYPEDPDIEREIQRCGSLILIPAA